MYAAMLSYILTSPKLTNLTLL